MTDEDPASDLLRGHRRQSLKTKVYCWCCGLSDTEPHICEKCKKRTA